MLSPIRAPSDEAEEAAEATAKWRAWCRRVNDPEMTDKECDKAYARFRALCLPGPLPEEIE